MFLLDCLVLRPDLPVRRLFRRVEAFDVLDGDLEGLSSTKTYWERFRNIEWYFDNMREAIIAAFGHAAIFVAFIIMLP